jgi:hypothetical protein
MRHLALSLLALTALPVSALAQTPPAQIGAAYVPAPWWMNQPVIASIGYVRVELPANRANFTARFQVVERSSADATTKAADKVRELAKALESAGADKVRVTTTFTTNPLYEQYRDKEGAVQENRRADKIERYQVDAVITVEVRDIDLVEQTYAAVVAARPSSTSAVGFGLEPENESKTALYTEAVKDAARRAKRSVAAAGGVLGGVKVIDPTSRACQTDVLAGWPSYQSGEGLQPATVKSMYGGGDFAGLPAGNITDGKRTQVRIIGGANAADGDGAVTFYYNYGHNDPGSVQPEAMTLPLQPPMESMMAQACVVYGLA